ncbi:nucleotidyl transferase AbiEii/AbiGii toxin family protein [Microbacterium sp. SL62]|uniref:nucleotidyl transferase AbiEii/AbiGii toxin family protein n=1 Tax=Microbacterium sp. SL62 TaxID=2995139 RepID=UPI0022723991|nr:nucleotidyl transferase AbiEii/AbiGii toxin family protein [Microbacterium sp. SL62]MCY1718674.1 nucleotidyl transferase AbiEii/AbiGii toxin family protein [Microbacterium sp. SL62]
MTRDDIIDGIREIIARLTHAGVSATIKIVGGAAVALTIDGDRPATVDVDGPFSPREAVEAVAVQIAEERGWPLDWVNDKAKIFLPDGMGRGAEWVTLYDKDGILVQAASAAMLLAMKLRAAERRGLRDLGDVDVLLTVLGIQTADEAEDLMNEFFPSEDLSPRTYDRVQKLLDGEPRVGSRPNLPDLAP